MLTTSIADGVARLVSSPERSDGGSTILACDDNRGVLALDLQRCDVDRRGIVGVTGGLRLGCALAFQNAQARTLGDPIVVSRAAAASLGTACAVTSPSART